MSLIQQPALWLPSWGQDFAGPDRLPPAYPNAREGLVCLLQPTLGVTGATLHDVSGFPNDGDLIGTAAPTWATSSEGPVVSLDGIDQNVQIPASSSIDDMPAFSVLARVLFDTRATFQALLGKKGAAAASGWGLFKGGNNGRLDFRVDYTDGTATDLQRETATDFLPIDSFGTWINVAVTWDGSSDATNVHIYFNGVEEQGYRTTNNGNLNRVSDAGNDLFIGQQGNGFGDLAGDIAYVAIYNRVVPEATIRALDSDPHAIVRPKQRIWVRGADVSSSSSSSGVEASSSSSSGVEVSPSSSSGVEVSSSSSGVGAGVGGPYCVAAKQVFHTGAAAGQAFFTGAAAGQHFHTGAEAGQKLAC